MNKINYTSFSSSWGLDGLDNYNHNLFSKSFFTANIELCEFIKKFIKRKIFLIKKSKRLGKV